MGKRWTQAEMDLLREMYQTHHIDAICDTLGRNRHQLYDKARLLKLHRPNEVESQALPIPTQYQYTI
jgi:hypothetical protein